MAQRAPRWLGYVVAGLIIGFAVVHGFDGFGDAAVYLRLAMFSVAFLLINLPDALPARPKLALCSGGALVSMTIIWVVYQIKPEVTRYGAILIWFLLAAGGRMLATRWMGKPKRS